MADSLHSQSLDPLKPSDSTIPAIKEAIRKLKQAYPEKPVQAHRWNKHYIAVALPVRVNRPSRGPVGNIDIRAEEPVLLLLHHEHYPYRGTLACSDRLYFPHDRLPHLTLMGPALPAIFCLHRGNFDDWMAERTIFHLVKRVRDWLCDAACNRLIPPGDGWEPIRIESYGGVSIYSASELQQYVQERSKSTNGKEGFSLLRYKLSSRITDDPLAGSASNAIEVVEIVARKDANQVASQVRKLNKRYDTQQPTDRFLLGMLIWTAEDNICDSYFADIPTTLPQLSQWGGNLGLPINRALDRYQRKRYQLFNGIPIILAIRRPSNLIGDTSDIELVNLVICSDEGAVFPMRNISPLTTEKAQLISGIERLDCPNILAVGCGALGSKIEMHLARAGLTNMTLVDHDVLLPHNLVRHSLLADRVSNNKADALREEIDHMYRGQAEVTAVQANGIDILRGNKKHPLNQYTWLIDTTASKAFEQALIDCQQLDGIRVVRAEIAHRGQIGMMSIEGSERNPRLDDIKVYLSTLACEQDYLSDWLKAGRTAEKLDLQVDEIPIGMGCHTDTMVLADDAISFHAALMSTSFKHQITQASDEGYLQLSFLGHDGDVSRQEIPVPTVEIFQANNDDFWEIRVAKPVKQEILKSVAESAPNETGGILMGNVNPNHKVVHVTKVLPPPPDSRSTPYMFERGVNDIPDTVRRIQSRTGGLIDYVGEWHSHPNGGGQMSEQDQIAARQLQDILKSSGRPVHIMIATPTNLHSHVYAGDTTI